MIDHDRLFKELLTTFFAEFLDLFLPELSGNLDRRSIGFLDKEVFTDVPWAPPIGPISSPRPSAAGRTPSSSFTWNIKRSRRPSSQAGCSATLPRCTPATACPSIRFLPRSLQPEPDEYRVGFPDLEVLRFRYRVIQLSRLNWRDFVRRSNPVAGALMARMAHGPGRASRG